MQKRLPEIGEVIAQKFRVERLLGRGGMGCVYAVTHLVTGKMLALKCLLPQFANNPAASERFLREARAAGRVQHRHVIDVFDVGHDGWLSFMIMPFLDGLTLTDLLKKQTLTLEHALAILIRVMEGVAAAHAMGVVHRDLKPCNILICRGMSGLYDDPRVLDFGISKVLADEQSSLTESGATLGTPNYMAIEQLMGNRDVDSRADIFAMGVILYETLTGRLPHSAQNVAALAVARLTIPPIDLAILLPGFPSSLTQAVMRAIATAREDRQQTMQELIEALRPFGRDTQVTELTDKMRDRSVLSTTTLPRDESGAPQEELQATPAHVSNPDSASAARLENALRGGLMGQDRVVRKVLAAAGLGLLGAAIYATAYHSLNSSTERAPRASTAFSGLHSRSVARLDPSVPRPSVLVRPEPTQVGVTVQAKAPGSSTPRERRSSARTRAATAAKPLPRDTEEVPAAPDLSVATPFPPAARTPDELRAEDF